jgi:hypothetical protein
MPDQSENEQVRAWRVRYELAQLLAAYPGLESALLIYTDGTQISVMDKVRIYDPKNESELTLDQVPGYIDALEKALAADAAKAREELAEMERGEDA